MSRIRKNKLLKTISIILVTMILVTGCGNSSDDSSNNTSTTNTETGDQLILCEYTDRDKAGTYDESQATKVTLEDTYTITEEGVYIFTGTLKDGQIIVNADDTAKVQIVLAGVDITCSDGPAIYGENANKIFITTAEGTENTLTDGSTYSSTEDQPWGCVFTTCDLTINGSGNLTVDGNYNNGIVSKDDLRITGGTINVTAVNDGLRGRDSVGILDGVININATGDGISSNNDEEEDKGFVSIDGGTIDIQGATSQGIQGYTAVQLVSGTLTIDSENEGIESAIIYISGTKSTITASDDGLNASNNTNGGMDVAEEGTYIRILGGETYIEAYGDGIDSNGDLYVTGGITVVNGPTNGGNGSLDYAGTGQITGGTIITLGASGMAQNFDNSSTQGVVLTETVSGSAGDTVTVLDSEGNEIISTTAIVNFSSVIISVPDMAAGSTYTLKIGSTSTEITLTDTVTSIGATTMGGGAQGGGQMNGGQMGGNPGGGGPGGF